MSGGTLRWPQVVWTKNTTCRLPFPSSTISKNTHLFVCDTWTNQVSRGAGVNHFIIHARKAILGGLSPAQNRNIPPLKYDYVYRLVKDFPDVDFTLNGGVNTYGEVRSSVLACKSAFARPA